MRDPADLLSERDRLRRALADEPWRYELFEALRRIDCLHPELPRLGTAQRPADEPLRVAQAVSLSFAPASLAAFAIDEEPPRLEQRAFGLLGPNGPLPIHLTDFVRERLLHFRDTTLARFLDLFNHRFLLFFYRAWAQAEPAASLDRPRQDRFGAYVGSLIGVGGQAKRDRDAVGDHAKLYHAGLLARHVRNADGLVALLSSYFRLPVAVEQYVGHWMRLPESERTRLGGATIGNQLGVGAVLGESVWDRQHKIRLHFGPLTREQYESFLPGGTALPKLVALMRQYLSLELAWDLRLKLLAAQVPPLRLGGDGRLGWSTWLGHLPPGHDGDELTLEVESLGRVCPDQAVD